MPAFEPADETRLLEQLLGAAQSRPVDSQWIEQQALGLIEHIRAKAKRKPGVASVMVSYPLREPEGRALMELAEALSRTPDIVTLDALIADKLATGDWAQYPGRANSWQIRALALALVVINQRLCRVDSQRGAWTNRLFDGLRAGMLSEDPCIDGVMFTGSVATARRIYRALARRGTRLPALVAETGGQNAMVVDSSALLEQVVDDVISSAFHSAGQRCSALRVLFVQDDIADRLSAMLAGAMGPLYIGAPTDPATDVGPVIDRPALDLLRFRAGQLDRVLDAINSTGFGLTMGIHSRLCKHIDRLVAGSAAGNVYVNRNMIGAVVGVQPFGGHRLSGTGPKAGGPHYLQHLLRGRAMPAGPPTYIAGVTADLVLLRQRQSLWRRRTLPERIDQVVDWLGREVVDDCRAALVALAELRSLEGTDWGGQPAYP